MKRLAIILVLTASVGVAMAQQPTTNAMGVQQQLAAIDAQLAAVRAQTRDSAQLDIARKASMDADKAYANALAAIPSIKALDDQIAAARDQMRDLMMRRQQALAANAEQVSVIKKARDEAAANVRQAVMGGTTGQQLMLRRQQLIMALGASGAATSSSLPVEIPATNVGQ